MKSVVIWLILAGFGVTCRNMAGSVGIYCYLLECDVVWLNMVYEVRIRDYLLQVG